MINTMSLVQKLSRKFDICINGCKKFETKRTIHMSTVIQHTIFDNTLG